MVTSRRPADDVGVRGSRVVTVVAAGGAALVLGGVAIAAARAVPDTPSPAYVSNYVEDLEQIPLPASSASILAGVGTVPATTATTVDDKIDVPTTVDDHGGDREGRPPDEDSSGPGSGGPESVNSGSSGSGSGHEAPDDG